MSFSPDLNFGRPVSKTSEFTLNGHHIERFEPTRLRDKVYDQIVPRLLGWFGTGVGFLAGTILERYQSVRAPGK